MIKIELEPQRYKDIPGVAEKNYVSKTVLRMYCKHAGHDCRLQISYTAPDGLSRREYQGPILPGPYASTFPLGVVIDNHGGSGAESRKLREAGLEFDVAEGDEFELDGMRWTIRDDVRLGYPRLYPIDVV